MTNSLTTSDLLNHLTDGAPVFAPHALVGHYHCDDPRSSLLIVRAYPHLGTAPHPYSGQPMIAVDDVHDQRLYVSIRRLAHARGCGVCDPVWAHFDALLRDLPDDAMLTGTMPVPGLDDQVRLLVDAEDLPAESEDDR